MLISLVGCHLSIQLFLHLFSQIHVVKHRFLFLFYFNSSSINKLKSNKYLNKTVYIKLLNFFDYLFSNHIIENRLLSIGLKFVVSKIYSLQIRNDIMLLNWTFPIALFQIFLQTFFSKQIHFHVHHNAIALRCLQFICKYSRLMGSIFLIC
ncbi:hypothetical protein RFI_33000 [Reticulomyxa filosa]|uniref:Uncharacterized protein n=1 Tax=Reticulomyxa filosa TaxID=46433 RepID=X6LSS0_RETFI|nr:hypothetical protein RFI_33000 [Reticulomyxa filosa]|eukprot:ETO04396.1 hypothetical protein RFI_33000 [Reticulomyxa filosa]